MDKKPLIGVSIIAVVLLVLGSLSNVVGYQPVRSTVLSDSPLFSVRTQRANHQQQNMITFRYLGEETGFENDTTPPITICILNPPEPDGENGWYVSKIVVTLIASDDYSGVNITKYQIDGGSWQTYLQPFNITTDSSKHTIEYFSVDNAGNTEPTKNATFAMDRTRPVMTLSYNVTGGNGLCGWVLTFYLDAHDATSGMNRTECYINDDLQETIVGPGPLYEWDYWGSSLKVTGFIRNLGITEEFVKFYANIVIMISTLRDFVNAEIFFIGYDDAGNWIKEQIEHPSFRMPIEPGFYFFQDMTLPNNFTGYIGRYFIRATFSIR